MSIIQWLGIVSAAIAGNAIGFLIFRKRIRSEAQVPELMRGIRIVRVESGPDCDCDMCRNDRRKQAEAAPN